jgi:hypothetical protein
MNLELNKIAKYLIGGIVIFFVLKYVTQDKFKDLDIGLMAVIAMLIFMVVEYTHSLVTSKSESSEETSAKCQSYCAMKEGLENVGKVENSTATTRTPTALGPSDAQSGDNATSSDKSGQAVTNEPGTKNSPDYAELRNAVNKSEQQRAEHNDKYIVESNKISRNADGTYTINLWRDPQAQYEGSRPESGVIQNETKYNYGQYNVIPPNLNEGTFESGYSFLPPAAWFPQPPFPPVCVAEKRCSVCPALTNKDYADLKEWNESRRVYQPDGINTDYVTEKLNSGR